MLVNYLKIAIRNLNRHRRHSLLNIAGLAVAIGACIIIFLVIQYEFSYDNYHSNRESIYQVVTKDVDAEGEHYTSGVPFPAIKFLRKDFPQFTFVQLMQNTDNQVSAIEPSSNGPVKKFVEPIGVFYAEPELFRIFDVRWLSGNGDVLQDVSSAVMSKSFAAKYFGNWESAIGKSIKFNNETFDYKIAAVFDDVPANSDFPFNIVVSYDGFVAHDGDNWPLEDWGSNTSNHQVYALIPASANKSVINQQLLAFEKKYNSNKETTRTHFLQPLKNIHFDDRFSNNGDHITSRSSLQMLAFIGVLIILMACINFINLSTALAVTRSKEVGIRKVMGGSRGQLRWQVLTETLLVVMGATLAGIGLAWIALPYVKHIMVVQAPLQIFNPQAILFIASVVILTTLLSGLYPATMLSSFKPVEAIKNKINTTSLAGISLRRSLVVLQFAFSQILVIATIIAIGQMRFIKSADLGFNKDAVMLIPMNSDSATRARLKPFKDALLARADIKQVSFSFDAPSSDNSWQSNFAFDKMEDRDFNLTLKFGDENYQATYGMQLVAGKYYDASDTARGFVVNETFVKKVGLKDPQEAIGKMVRLGGSKPKPVVGVVKDFKFQSLREAIPPIAISPRVIYYGTTGIKLSGSNLLRSKEEIQKVWEGFFPEYVYNPAFFEDNINRFYEQEARLTLMYKVYALLAILISCLGLYGLVSFMVVRKTKEVGIRKVLGASVKSIVYLFSKEFTILIGIAFVLAAPAAWWLMNNWLQNFAYKIPIGVSVFIIAIVISILIAWATVGYKALRAAMANPAISLRSE